MPLTPSFTATQPTGLPGYITLTDDSSGSDVAITQRRIFLQTADGSYLVPTGVTTDYIEWSIADPTITVDVLTEDTALSITVQWLNVTDVVLYTLTEAYGFTSFNEAFYYSLTQNQVSNPQIVDDTYYYGNKLKLRVEIDSGNQAITWAGDIYAAQAAYNRATYLVTNQDIYF